MNAEIVNRIALRVFAAMGYSVGYYHDFYRDNRPEAQTALKAAKSIADLITEEMSND